MRKPVIAAVPVTCADVCRKEGSPPDSARQIEEVWLAASGKKGNLQLGPLDKSLVPSLMYAGRYAGDF